MTMYQGECVGGPHDGGMLQYHSNEFHVYTPVMNGAHITSRLDGVYYFVGGRWVWEGA
jgi:hypothetical protein